MEQEGFKENRGTRLETPPIYENLSAWENLKVRALMLGETEDRIREVLKIVDLLIREKSLRENFRWE